MKLRIENIVKILLTSFIIVSFHFALHNSFDHKHDASCAVYVLEELYAGADVLGDVLILTLFIPFLFVAYNVVLPTLKVQKLCSIRAPPYTSYFQ